MKAQNWCALAAFVLATVATAATPEPKAHDAANHAAPPAAAHAPSEPAISPDDALKSLIEGNERFTADRLGHPNSTAARRCETFTGGQHPIATVLACADSRAPVEFIFDQGIGDLFVIRVAGNVADTDEIGTIEYGAGHLHTPLIVVMGHTKCGAVTAVVQEAKVSPNIAKLVDNIVPAVAAAKKTVPGSRGDALIVAAIDANVFQAIQDLLANSEEVRHLLAEKKVKVVGAVYDLHIGGVRWLGEHPRQAELLKAPIAAGEHKEELLHSAKPSAKAPVGHAPEKHEAPKASPHTATPTESHPAAHGPQSSAHNPTAPHEAGTIKGILLPAAFLGGAGVVSGAIFQFMKSRSHAPAAPAASAAPTPAPPAA